MTPPKPPTPEEQKEEWWRKYMKPTDGFDSVDEYEILDLLAEARRRALEEVIQDLDSPMTVKMIENEPESNGFASAVHYVGSRIRHLKSL